MRNKLPFFLIFIFFSIQAYGWDPSTKIAVLGIDSRIKGEEIDTTSFTEMIQGEFVKEKAYIIVERAQLSKILDEQKLQTSGIADNDATRVGSIAGASKIITGSLFKIDDEYQLLIKVIDISSGTIEIYEEIKGDYISEVSEQIPDAVRQIIQKSKSDKIEEQPQKTNDQEPKTIRSAGFFPIQLSFVRRIQLIPENFTIGGAAIVLISGYNERIYGIQAGVVINEAGTLFGLQTGLINKSADLVFGLQAGLLNFSKGEIYGAQIGLINNAENVKGVQIGLVNITQTLFGAQIGLVNLNRKGWVGFMPFINISF